MNQNLAVTLAIAVAISVFPATTAQGEYVIAPGFSQTSAVPANFQNSTVLSLAVAADSDLLASSGRDLASFSFDSTLSAPVHFPFATDWIGVDTMRYDASGNLNFLTYNYQGAGAILRFDGTGGYTQVQQLGSNQSFPRGFAYKSDGQLLVAGTYGSINEPGWVRSYDSAGNLALAFDTSIAPVAVAYAANGQPFIAGFDGGIYTLSGSSLIPFAQLDADWVGYGVGHVESLAIDDNNNLFVGVNLGQAFDTNSSAILRISPNDSRVLAFGIDEIPVDMIFGPGNQLLIASFTPNGGSHVYRFTGDFGGAFSNAAIPEPALMLFLLGTPIFVHRRTRQFTS